MSSFFGKFSTRRHFRAAKSRRKPFPTSAASRLLLRGERLEDRHLLAGDLRLVSVELVQPNAPFTATTPVVGEQVFVKATFETTNVNAGASYRLQATLDGVPLSQPNVTSGAGITGTNTFTRVWGGWFASPGNHTVGVTLDADNTVSETNETNNTLSPALTFTSAAPTTLPERFVTPLGGTAFTDWSVIAYMDVNPSPSANADFNGGAVSYEGHTGHDFTLPNFAGMDAGVPVYAAAGGTVESVADGFFDRNMVGSGQANLVVINHGNGWKTTYLHFATNTITVKVGDTVGAGHVLGMVGSSGNSSGPHLHWSVSRNGALVETGYSPSAYFVSALPYQGTRPTTMLDSGISNAAPTSQELAERPTEQSVFSTSSTNDVAFWFNLSHLHAGEQYAVKWVRPDGSVLTTQNFPPSGETFGGIYFWTLPAAGGWTTAPGTWTVRMEKGGQTFVSRTFSVVSGAGVAAIKVRDGSTTISDDRTTAVSIGAGTLGGAGPSKTFTILNQGSSSLNLSNLIMPSGFTLSSAFPASIAAGASASFSVSLDTSSAGSKFGAVEFTTNDPDVAKFNFHVSGTVSGAAQAGAPVISLPSAALAYRVYGQASALDPLATVTDSDSANFNGGNLTVSFTTVSSTLDLLAVRNVGTGAGQIGVSGGSVSFGGTAIGTVSGGTNGTPLVVSFNANATTAAVQALLRQVTFSTTAANPETLARYVKFSILDAAGGKRSNEPIRVVAAEEPAKGNINQTDLSISSTDSPDPVTAGSNITYTITVRNNGPRDATSVSLSNAVPANTTFVSFAAPAGWNSSTPAVNGTGNVSSTLSLLTAGTTATFTLVVRVNPGTAAASITNTSSISTSTPDSLSGNNTAVSTTAILGQADLAVTNVDTPDPVIAGNNISYTITVTNNGPGIASNVSLSDSVPANTTFVSFAAPAGWTSTTPAVAGTGLVTSTLPALASGASATFTLVVRVNPGTLATSISNSASATTTTTDPVAGNNSATATTAVATQTDLAITNVDAPDPVVAGNNLTYTITVRNNGPLTAQNVSLSDAIPANTTFVSFAAPAGWNSSTPAVGGTGSISSSIASLASGATATFTLVARVNVSAPAGSITNTATVATTTPELNSSNNTAVASTAVSIPADLAVTNSDSPDPVIAGNNITYAITVRNNGPRDATNVSLTDVIPANTTFVSFTAPAGWNSTTPAVGGTGTVSSSIVTLTSGTTATFSLVVRVNPGTTATSVTNTASASASTFDAIATNNSAATTTTITPVADLVVTNADSPDPVIPGNNLTYTLTVRNNGPREAQSVSLTDAIPANTTFVSLAAPVGWTSTTPAVGGTGTVTSTIPTLSSGVTATFTLVVRVNAGTTAASISNTASAATTSLDPNLTNNSAVSSSTVAVVADLAVTNVDSPDPVVGGNDISYAITVTNNGPRDAQNVSLSDTVPANTTFVSFTTPAGWNSTTPAVGGSGLVTSTIPVLAAGASASFTLVARVNFAAPPVTVTNTATVSAGTTDPNSANNSATASTLVLSNVPVARPGGPYNGFEGTAIQLNGSTSSDHNQVAATLNYDWDLNFDGVTFHQDLTGPQPQFTPLDNFGTRTIALRVTDDDGLSHLATTTLAVANLPPVVSAQLEDNFQGVVGQTRTLVLSAEDASSVDQAAGFTFVVNWGEGMPETISGPAGTRVSHIYNSAGTFTISVSGRDKDQQSSSAAPINLSISEMEVQNGALVTSGTAGNDAFIITPSPNSSQVTLVRDGKSMGSFAPPAGGLKIFGQAGTDKITVNGTALGDNFVIAPGSVSLGALVFEGVDIASWQLNGLAGDDTFTFLPGGAASIDGGKHGPAGDTVVGSAADNDWQLLAAGAGALNGSAFKNIENLSGGEFSDTFRFTKNAASFKGRIEGGNGGDTLDYGTRSKKTTTDLTKGLSTGAGKGISSIEQFVGSTAATDVFVGPGAAGVWSVEGNNRAVLNGNVVLVGFENLTGGAGNDEFHIGVNGALTGKLNGGSGVNTLSYAERATAVNVNLATGKATSLAKGVKSFQIVMGGAGDDILIGRKSASSVLVGGPGNDTLTGGTARDLLLGGLGSDKLNGGKGDDLLLAGASAFDQNVAALLSLQTEWTSARLYAERVANLRGTGIGPRANGENFLSTTPPATILDDNGLVDTLLGGAGKDWFIAGLEDLLPDLVTAGLVEDVDF